jgi:hypothetical protein
MVDADPVIATAAIWRVSPTTTARPPPTRPSALTSPAAADQLREAERSAARFQHGLEPGIALEEQPPHIAV